MISISSKDQTLLAPSSAAHLKDLPKDPCSPLSGYGLSPIDSIADLDPQAGFANLVNSITSFISHLEVLLQNKQDAKLSLLREHEEPIVSAKKVLSHGCYLLEILHDDRFSIQNLATEIKDYFIEQDFALIPLFNGENAPFFLYLTKEGLTLFNPEATGTKHPKTIEKGFDSLTESSRIKLKIQQVLFLENIEDSLFDDINFFISLVSVSKESKNKANLSLLENFVFNTLPTIAKSSWQPRKSDKEESDEDEESLVLFKKGQSTASANRTINDLFYHLLMELSSFKEDARAAYKVIRFFQKKDLLLQALSNEELSPYIDPQNLCKTALKLFDQGLVSQNEVDESYILAKEASEVFKGGDPLLKGAIQKQPLPDFSLRRAPHFFEPFNTSIELIPNPISRSLSVHKSIGLNIIASHLALSTIQIPLFEDPRTLQDDLESIHSTFMLIRPYEFNEEAVQFFLEQCIENIPSLRNDVYWNQIENKDVRKILETIYALLSSIINRLPMSNSFNSLSFFLNASLLKWTLYAVGERLARKTQQPDPFQNAPITRKNFIYMAKKESNATFNPKIRSRFEDLIAHLLPAGFNIHDPSCSIESSEILFPTNTSSEDPSATDLFFRQYLPVDLRKDKKEVYSILLESLSPEGARIPLEIKLLQQLSLLVHSSSLFPSKPFLIDYSKTGYVLKHTGHYKLQLALGVIKYGRECYYNFESINICQRHAEYPAKPHYFWPDGPDSVPNPQILQYKLSPKLAELRRIWSDPRDSINRFIGYFSENSINNFDDGNKTFALSKSWEELACITFFRPGRLDEQLKDHPDFINTLTRFLVENIHKCIEEPILYSPKKYNINFTPKHRQNEVLLLGLSLKHYLKSCGSPLADKLPHFLSLIDTSILPAASTPDEISAVYFAKFLAIMLETPEELHEPSDDLIAIYLAGRLETSSIFASEWANLRTLAATQIKLKLKKMESNKDLRNNLLNKTAALFGFNQTNTTVWVSGSTSSERNEPTYRSSIGRYYIDHEYFLITSLSNTYKTVTDLLEQGHLGKAIHIHDLRQEEQTDSRTFKLSSATYPEEISVTILGDSFLIQKIRGLDLYTFIPTKDITKKFPDLCLTHPDLIKETARIWSSPKDLVFEKENGEEIFIPKEALSIKFDMLLPELSQHLLALGFRAEQCQMENEALSQFNLINGKLRLGFQITGNKAYSKKHSGYYLTLNRFANMPVPYLILETAKGEKRLLAVYNEEAFSFDLLNEETLSPISACDKLAYLALLQGSNPKESHKILDSLASSLTRRFSSLEKELLIGIIMSMGHPQDRTHISLKAFCLLLEELIKFPPSELEKSFTSEIVEKTPLFEVIIPRYLDYLNDQGNRKNYFISKNQEIVLLQFLVRIIPGSLLETGLQAIPKKILSDPWKNSLKDLGLSFLRALHPIRSIEVNGSPLIPEIVLSFPILRDRLESLEEDKLSIGVYKPKVFSVKLGLMSADAFKEHISAYKESKKIEIKELLENATSWSLPELFIGDQSIEKNFAAYYTLAQEASKEELYKLRCLFERAKNLLNDSSPEIDSFALLLEAPKAYQTLYSLKNTLSKIEAWEEFIQTKEGEIRTYQSNPKGSAYENFANFLSPISAPLQITFAKVRILWLNLFFHSFGLVQSIQSVALTSFKVIGALFKDNIALYFSQKVTIIKTSSAGPKTPLSFSEASLFQEEKQFTNTLTSLGKSFIRTAPYVRETHDLEAIFESHPEELAHLQEYLLVLNSNTYAQKKDLGGLSSLLKGLIRARKDFLDKTEGNLLKKLDCHLDKKTNKQIIHDLTQKEMDLESLLLLFLDGSLEGFQRSLTLSPEEIDNLFKETALYLTKKTHLNQLITAENNLERYLSSENLDEKAVLFDLFVASLQKRRAYDLTIENRAKLLFEAFQGISLRQAQVEKINTISETLLQKGKKILFEMATGAGKTHAILPSSNMETSNGQRLTINIFPEAISKGNIESNKFELGKLNIGVDAAYFQRSTYLSNETLSYLHRQLLSDIENKKPLNTTAETIQSLKLHLISIFLNGKERGSLTPQEKQHAESLRQILRLIKTKGAANIDEARATLNPFDRLIYTQKEQEPLTDKEIEIFDSLFLAIFQNDHLSKIFLANRHPDDISEKDYQEQIAPALASHMAKKLNISKDYELEFIGYVLGKTNRMDPWLIAHPKKEDICLVRGLLLLILPDALSGHINQNYGFSKKHRGDKGFAIPYISSNEAKETETSPSEFQNRHETASKTLIALFYEGLDTLQLNQLFAKICLQYAKEQTLHIPSKESIALENFRKVFNVDPFLTPDKVPVNFTELQEKEIKHKPDAILSYFKEILAKKIKTYKKTLVSTSSDFLKQFSSSSSMTATPQHEKAHDKETVFKTTLGSKGFIPYHYFANGMGISSIAIGTYATLMQGCLSKIKEEHHNALIDAGGLFRGHENRKIADDLLTDFRRSRPEIEEVVYFDEKKQEFVALNKNSPGLTISLKESEVDPSCRFTFFDMARTVGSDIKQGATASAAVLLEFQTSKSDLGQAIGRMRELPYGQRVSYVVSNELSDALYGPDESLYTLNDKKKILYDHLLKIERDLESRYNLSSIKQQIDADIHDLVLTSIYEATSLNEAFDIFNADAHELVTENSIEASSLYGTLVLNTPSNQELDRFLASAKKRILQLHCLTPENKEKEKASISKYETLWRGENSIALPETTISSNSDLNAQCDVLLETQQETQVQVSAKSNSPELWMRPVSNWSNRIQLFEQGWDEIHRLKTISTSFFNNTTLARLWARLQEDHPIKLSFIAALITTCFTTAISCFLLLVSWKVQLAVSVCFGIFNLVKMSALLKQYLKTAPPLFHVRDLARREFGKTIADQLIDLDLLVTNNLSNQEPMSLALGAQELFTYEQKPAYQMLFTLDEQKTQAILVDQNDSIFLRGILAKDRETTLDILNKRTRQVVLYDLRTNTIVAQGANRISEEDLKSIPRFFSYTALGKLWDRRIHFEREELSILQEKADLIGRPVMKSIYEKHLLSDVSQNTINSFYQSRLGKYICAT